MPEDKAGLMNLIGTRRASTFDPTNVASHGSTKYMAWKDQEDGTFVDLPCVRSDGYEPFLALRYCRELPPFQEGFSAVYGQSTVRIIFCVRLVIIMPIPHVMLLLIIHLSCTVGNAASKGWLQIFTSWRCLPRPLSTGCQHSP